MCSFPLISVVVPIYGIERYLGLCIESIIKQTYTNLEVILVDDGSKDRCPEICDLYAQKDNRIVVVHKDNGGLVSARKAGLSVAHGVYVGYVDGDDWIEPTFYESLYKAISKSNSDLVVAGQSKDLFDSKSTITSFIPSGLYETNNLERLKRNMISYGHFFRIGITTYVWNKLFKRDLLIDCQTSVPNNITIGEDAAVVYPYIMKCKSIRIIDSFDYHYRQREDSMLKKTTSFSSELTGLKSLYYHLCSFASKYDSGYYLKDQIDDFLLGICIMRSGGIWDNKLDDNNPYSGEFYKKKVIIWSAGTYGQQLYNRIIEKDYCKIVGWVDEDYWEYRRCCLNVDPIDDIDQISFDYVLIATINSVSALQIKERLIWRGIEEDKILLVDCPKEKRKRLLQKYLSM